ncbi:hypothetical protein [Solibacillus sp. CAU 1738]|uniref:hypothetical protein n=1 Tax=Solibacillus sp. CAU 1738 TaxID=3140363 RepID=UPI003260C8A9
MKNQINEREQLESLTIEQLVPEYNLVLKLDVAIDFNIIYPLVDKRPSVKEGLFL